MSVGMGKYVTCDATKCSGCRACEMACFAEHNRIENGVGKTIGTVEVPVTPKLYVTRFNEYISAPIQCKHCEDSPCINVCSKNAITRINGQVIANAEKCIGCKDCMLACPFGAIDLLPVHKDKKPVWQMDGCTIEKVASKCNLCMDNPEGPACVRVCPNNALRIVEPSDEKTAKNKNAVKALYDVAVMQKELGGNYEGY